MIETGRGGKWWTEYGTLFLAVVLFLATPVAIMSLAPHAQALSPRFSAQESPSPEPSPSDSPSPEPSPSDSPSPSSSSPSPQSSSEPSPSPSSSSVPGGSCTSPPPSDPSAFCVHVIGGTSVATPSLGFQFGVFLFLAAQLMLSMFAVQRREGRGFRG